MEKHSAAYAAEPTKSINFLIAISHYTHFISRRVESFCFSASLPCGMRSLFLWGQRKAKKQKLCVLCGSNEQSEWAVSYCIKTEAISNLSRSKTTIFCMISIFVTVSRKVCACNQDYCNWRYNVGRYDFRC